MERELTTNDIHISLKFHAHYGKLLILALNNDCDC